MRNNRSAPIKINIYDQIPISSSSDIIVTVDNISKAVKDDLTGETVCEVLILPSETFITELAYTVKYLKHINISVQKFKMISCLNF